MTRVRANALKWYDVLSTAAWGKLGGGENWLLDKLIVVKLNHGQMERVQQAPDTDILLLRQINPICTIHFQFHSSLQASVTLIYATWLKVKKNCVLLTEFLLVFHRNKQFFLLPLN